ncbi:MAG TPA: hypothetical protein VE152_00860, partial [Acidimicrobiales bacterium]|nr:hypothetical protein [Acidimicrobiales bacterium]
MSGQGPDGASGAPAEPPGDLRPPTEARNPATVAIDRVPTLALVRLLNDEDHRVPRAVAAILPELAAAVEETTTRLAGGGRLHYVGAGTSGRVAAMDAAELPPTFGLPPGAVVAHLAGGPAALAGAVEEVEDDEEAGARAVADAAA